MVLEDTLAGVCMIDHKFQCQHKADFLGHSPNKAVQTVLTSLGQLNDGLHCTQSRSYALRILTLHSVT